MTPEKWREISKIFNAALSKKEDERSAFLHESCGQDAELLAEIHRLLEANDERDSFIDTSRMSLAPADAPKNLKKDDVLGSFQIIDLLGTGGMGEVYLARDMNLDRQVAIKVLPRDAAIDKNAQKRFQREAQAAAALEHPNICTIYEIGEESGCNFIVMQYVAGETLSQKLARGPLTPGDAVKIAAQVADALSEAHTRGIVHRDIKPANIIVSSQDQVKVLDFGLAKRVVPGSVEERSRDNTMLSQPGMILGTVSYMSPEQARGEEVDTRSDLWSLGVIFYEMLTGKVPFSGDTVNHTIVSILEDEPEMSGKTPESLQRITGKLLTKSVEARYRSARDLLADLKDLRFELDVTGELPRSVAEKYDRAEAHLAGKSPVESLDMRSATPSSSSLEYAITQAKSHKLATGITTVFLIAVLSVAGYLAFGSTKVSGQINSIAVMPFVNDGGDPDTEFLSDGMAETLIGSLSQIPNLSVKARSSVFRYKGKDVSTQTIGKELNVQAVLTGRVAQRGGQLILSVELVDVSTENAIWGQQYTRNAADLITLQSEVAGDVAGKLKSKLSGADAARVAKSYTANPEAYQLYLKGRYNWNRRTSVLLKQAVEFFKQAIEKDPNYALAYSGLAETYVLFPSWGVASSKESMPMAKAAALRALELDDSLAEAHAALAAYLTEFEYDRVRGEKEYRRAIELNPNYATARHWFALDILASTKRFDEALAELRRAEAIDPLSPVIGTNLGNTLVYARRYDEAIVQYKSTLSLDPSFAYAHQALGCAYGAKGNYLDAVAETRKAFDLNQDPTVKGYLGLWLARSGDRDGARRLLQQLKDESVDRYIPGYSFALIHVGLNEKSEALKWLEKVVSDGSPTLVSYAVSPELDDLRAEPRFKAMLTRLNLAE